MSDTEAYKLEEKTGCFVVDGHCKGLCYFLSKERKDKDRIAIGGVKGITILTREQAKRVAEDILDILEMYA